MKLLTSRKRWALYFLGIALLWLKAGHRANTLRQLDNALETLRKDC